MSSNKLFISYSEKIEGFGFCLQSRIPKWRNKKMYPWIGSSHVFWLLWNFMSKSRQWTCC